MIRAFTLIELLVVISIIGLLVAILLPALSNARSASQRTASLSNIRQISLSLFSYSSDSRESMPFQQEKYQATPSDPFVAYRWSRQWSRILVESNYLSNMEIYWSPARVRFAEPWPHTERTSAQLQHSYESVGYGLNNGVSPGHESDYVNATPATRKSFTPLNMSDGNAPAHGKMILLAEIYSNQGSIGGLNGHFISQAHLGGAGVYNPYHYNGSMIRSYLDGHAKALGSSATAVSGNKVHVGNAAYTMVNPDELGYTPDPTGGPYAGSWTLSSNNDRFYHMPWYNRWYLQWYKEYR